MWAHGISAVLSHRMLVCLVQALDQVFLPEYKAEQLLLLLRT